MSGAARTHLTGVLSELMGVGLAVVAVVAAVLPSRYWDSLYRLPVRAMVLPSALLTILVGLIAGARGFMAYGRLVADVMDRAALDVAARQATGAVGGEPITTLSLQTMSMTSVVAFTLFTPLGWLATYLTLSGLTRAAALVAGHAAGDPLLTASDTLVRLARSRRLASREAKRRARDEGPETPDRLFTGEGAGLDGVDFAVVAARRKPGWTPGTIVVTSDGWFRLGVPFDAHLPFGLRTVYPLTRLETPEVLRKAVSYALPPLQRGPGRLA